MTSHFKICYRNVRSLHCLGLDRWLIKEMPDCRSYLQYVLNSLILLVAGTKDVLHRYQYE